MIESADVILWGTRIGCVVRRDGVPYAEFEYAPDFIGCGIEPSPIEMPVASRSNPAWSLKERSETLSTSAHLLISAFIRMGWFTFRRLQIAI